jgi:hypothetical protein
MAAENARRTNIPLEYDLTGRSMKSPMPANAWMAGSRASVSSRDIPITTPYSSTFSRPVNSGLKPAPSSSSDETRPVTVTRPLVGHTIPAISCRSVLLPDPLLPTTPSVAPAGTRSETSLNAQKFV